MDAEMIARFVANLAGVACGVLGGAGVRAVGYVDVWLGRKVMALSTFWIDGYRDAEAGRECSPPDHRATTVFAAEYERGYQDYFACRAPISEAHRCKANGCEQIYGHAGAHGARPKSRLSDPSFGGRIKIDPAA